MTRPVFSRSLLSRQTPEVRAILAKQPRPKRKPVHFAPVTGTTSHEGDRLVVTLLGLALRLTQNSRCHWAQKARTVKHQRWAVFIGLRGETKPPLPLVVTIVRVGPKPLDSDNAVSAAKGCRDQIAQWLKIDDSDPRVTWVVQQERGPYAVRVVIAPRAQEVTT